MLVLDDADVRRRLKPGAAIAAVRDIVILATTSGRC